MGEEGGGDYLAKCYAHIATTRKILDFSKRYLYNVPWLLHVPTQCHQKVPWIHRSYDLTSVTLAHNFGQLCGKTDVSKFFSFHDAECNESNELIFGQE